MKKMKTNNWKISFILEERVEKASVALTSKMIKHFIVEDYTMGSTYGWTPKNIKIKKEENNE